MTGHEQEDLRLLVDECRRGDRHAQRALYERLVARVHALATRLAGAGDAEDVSQNVFLQMFRNLDQFRGDSKFETWVYRLTINEAFQQRRRRKRWSMASLGQDQLGYERLEASSNEASRLDERDLLEQALATLPDELRTLFVLREMEQLSYRELAAAVGVPEGTVASRLNRARQELRERMRNLGWDE